MRESPPLELVEAEGGAASEVGVEESGAASQEDGPVSALIGASRAFDLVSQVEDDIDARLS